MPEKAASGVAQDVHPLVKKALALRVPIGELLGFSVEEIADGRAVGVLQAGPQHANPMGTLHGGVLCDLADAAMGMAFVSTLAPDESFTTMGLNINYFVRYGTLASARKPVWSTAVRTSATWSVRSLTIRAS